MADREIRGYLYVLAAAALWGVSSVVVKSLFTLGLQPAQPVFIRLTLSSLILLLILLLRDPKNTFIDSRDWIYFLALAVGDVGGNQFFYY